MTILVTGGTGKTGSILAKLLHQAGIPVVIASRSAKAIEPFKSAKFDWSDPTTFENPFKADSSIDKVYVVSPDGLYDVIPVMKPFLEYAVSKGVKRFVALTGSQFNPVDGPSGATRQCVVSLGVDYTILRASWFMDNFSNGFDRTIRESNELCTCGEDGKVPFVAAQDIAQAAFDALTADKSPNKDLYIVGPELFSHDEAMLLLSQVLGREIKHKRVSVEHQRNVYSGIMPADFAIYLAGLEHMLAVGSEERVFNETDDKKVVGKHTLMEYFEANKSVWMK